jgi:hypothetical protein
MTEERKTVQVGEDPTTPPKATELKATFRLFKFTKNAARYRENKDKDATPVLGDIYPRKAHMALFGDKLPPGVKITLEPIWDEDKTETEQPKQA